MLKQLAAQLLLFLSLIISYAILNICSAHSNDISKASLSFENSTQYHLVVTVDVLHLLKRYKNISGDENEVIETFKKLSFVGQKHLLDKLHKDLTQQTIIRFTSIKDNLEHEPEQSFEHHSQHSINKLSGLSLSQLKKVLLANPEMADMQTQLHAVGKIPQNTKSVSIQFSALFSDVQLTVLRPENTLVSNNNFSEEFQVSTSHQEQTKTLSLSVKVIKNYILQGFVHILPRGLDHILFVLALLLFAKSRSSLIWQVSTFTLAHTITLGLSIYGFIQLPSVIIEPLIALSILYVALENNYRTNSNDISHIRMPIIFSFGLLHGLGFASVLRDVGLPESQYALSLVSFNIGVELGQLSVIVIALLCLTPVMKKHWYQSKLVKSLNIFIAITAAYWVIERVF